MGLIADAKGDPQGAATLVREAESQARLISDKAERAVALADLVATRVAIGMSEGLPALVSDAETFARAEGSDQRAGWALAHLVRAMTFAGEVDRAETLARAITNSHHRVGALLHVAQASVAFDLSRAEWLISEAADVASRIPADEFGDEALGMVVSVSAGRNDLDRAASVAATIAAPDVHAQALLDVIAALIQNGDITRATELTSRISPADRRAEALVLLASVSDRTSARQLLLQAFRLGTAEPPLALLGELDPPALVAILNDLLVWLIDSPRATATTGPPKHYAGAIYQNVHTITPTVDRQP